MEVYKTYYQSEIGWIEITGNDDGVMTLEFVEARGVSGESLPKCIDECVTQLDEYFQGKRQEFSVKLNWQGTEFQVKVWEALLTVPYGKTASYMGIARKLGDEKAVRAVGTANGRNNIAIIVPCHRVIGSSGSLTGYAYGVWRKDWLLKHEAEYSKAEKQMDLF
ncbi:MAG: methylated-DNA--[protein]-cysteine S-methyltransferase [Bacteroidetes bacterium]|nr:methylated-DNA--[protein]-cysteine S-methyltransferase [Bacteroidota bacterium]